MSDLCQQQITGGVAHRIVDQLELVDIDEENGAHLPGLATGYGLLEPFPEQPAIGKIRQLVVMGPPMNETHLGELSLGCVFGDTGEANDIAVSVTDVKSAIANPADRAGWLHDPVFVFEDFSPDLAPERYPARPPGPRDGWNASSLPDYCKGSRTPSPIFVRTRD